MACYMSLQVSTTLETPPLLDSPPGVRYCAHIHVLYLLSRFRYSRTERYPATSTDHVNGLTPGEPLVMWGAYMQKMRCASVTRDINIDGEKFKLI